MNAYWYADTSPAGRVREHQHEQQRDLVRDDVADRPTREPQHAAHRFVAPVEHEAEVHAGAGIDGTSTSAIAAMPAVVPRPSSQQQAVVPGIFSTSVHAACGPVATRVNSSRRAITTTLFSIGANAAAANRRRALSAAVASAVNP